MNTVDFSVRPATYNTNGCTQQQISWLLARISEHLPTPLPRERRYLVTAIRETSFVLVSDKGCVSATTYAHRQGVVVPTGKWIQGWLRPVFFKQQQVAYCIAGATDEQVLRLLLAVFNPVPSRMRSPNRATPGFAYLLIDEEGHARYSRANEARFLEGTAGYTRYTLEDWCVQLPPFQASQGFDVSVYNHTEDDTMAASNYSNYAKCEVAYPALNTFIDLRDASDADIRNALVYLRTNPEAYGGGDTAHVRARLDAGEATGVALDLDGEVITRRIIPTTLADVPVCQAEWHVHLSDDMTVHQLKAVCEALNQDSAGTVTLEELVAVAATSSVVGVDSNGSLVLYAAGEERTF